MERRKRMEFPKDYLKSDETVLWHGWSEPCRFLEGKDKTCIIRNWIIVCALFGGLITLYLCAVVEKSALLLVAFLVVWAVILYGPYVDWKKLKNQDYWVTDQRVIVRINDRDLYSVSMALVDAVDVKRLSTGNSCVLLGKMVVDEGEKHLRWRGGNPVGGSVAGEVGMLFYNVSDAEGAVAAIRSVRADV